MIMSRNASVLFAALVIIALGCGLYLPFLGNPPVFDDGGFFSGVQFSYYATHPFGLGLRLPPYFTLAITEIFFGGMPAHRVLSLLFHLLCGLVLYRLLFSLLQALAANLPLQSADATRAKNATLALIGASLFVIHPVAIYGAGYLVQRSIVFATLFSMLSLLLFLRGSMRRSYADAVSAGALYSVAILSKEHSLLLPLVAVPMLFIVRPDLHSAIRYVSVYWAVCLPCAIYVILLSKGVIATAYEPHVSRVFAQMDDGFAQIAMTSPLRLSMITQAGLFFKYIVLWIWPDVRHMSADLRVDFVAGWSPGWVALKIAGFSAFCVAGVVLLRCKGLFKLAGFGMLYVWIMFLMELSTARFQEPFVLYRSYLWAPGIVMIVAAGLGCFSRREVLAAFAIICPIFFYLAHDRLTTFTSPLALWGDAVAKLPETPVPWGSRTLSHLAGEQLRAGDTEKAIQTAQRCLEQYPRAAQCFFARGAIELGLGEFEKALPYLYHARDLHPTSGVIYDRIGVAYENLGQIAEARAAYRRASDLGFKGSDYRIDAMDNPGSGYLPPKKPQSAKKSSD